MNQDTSKRPIILAAGGTGGHIFPAEALAEVLTRMGQRVVLVTDSRFANFKTGVLAEIEIQTIPAGTVDGKLFKKVLGIGRLLVGIIKARFMLAKFAPVAVIGFGGYPSFPTVFSAASLGIPTIIHEQNSVLGRANRLLAGRVSRIATSFPTTLMLGEKQLAKVFMTGNPVRASIKALREVPYGTIGQDGKVHILVTGGSQGASVLSRVIPAAIALLPASLRARVRIDQQCRAADLAAVRAEYQQIDVNAELASFFVDLPARLANSHLVIARSGASTVSELAVAGRPAILVPLPTAMDNHQYFNANAFEDVGGGWVMAQDGFTPEALSARLEAFLTAPDVLSKAAKQARQFGEPDAAEKLAMLVMAAVKGESFDQFNAKQTREVAA